MNEKIVVCGAGGVVGRALVDRLIQEGHTDIRAVSRRWTNFAGVENVQANLWNFADCERIMQGAKWVFNLAAKVGGIGYIQNHKADCMLSSLINTNLLMAAKDVGISRYFFSSSSCVYPSRIEVVKESDAYPADPIDGYGWEKLFSERMCLAFSDDYGIPVTIARYHGLYGPGDVRDDAGKDHVIAAMCHKVVEAKLSGRNEINIWGDGSQTRSFLFIDDCVEGTLELCWNGVTGPVNLANSEPVSVNRIVDLLEEISGVKLTRFYSALAAVGRQHKCSDNQLLRTVLRGWEPATPIREGLEKTYRFFWDRAILK
jgi:GDP-D-mannose 3', 5'-epimerase